MNAIDKIHFQEPAYKPFYEYWSKQLAGGMGAFRFRQINMHATGQEEPAATCSFELPANLYNSIIARTGHNSAGIFVYMLGAFGILLKKYSGSKRITIDSPLYAPGFEGKIHAPATPLIWEWEDDCCLREYLTTVKEMVKQSYRHQNFPLELINEQRETRNSNVLMTYDAIHLETAHPQHYDLVIHIKRTARLSITLEYDPAAFEYGFIHNIQIHLSNVLESFEKLDTLLHDICVLSPQERIHLIEHLNRTEKHYPLHKTFQELFEAQVRRTPYATAVVFEETALTYHQLNEQANRLGRYLREEHDIRPNDIVGLLANRSERMIIGILGILKAGAAFLPIDTSTPAGRIGHILHDSGAKALLTDHDQLHNLDQATPPAYHLLLLDTVLQQIQGPATNPERLHSPSDLAYVIYTSGSTGQPKGVMITLKNLSHYLLWANDYYFDNILGKTFALFTNISFDLTITCIFTTLLRGDTLFVCGNKDISDILLELFGGSAKVNTVKMTPSHISMLSYLPLEETDVQHVIVGGETLTAFQVNTLQRLNPDINIYNEYGPTETTVGCTVKLVKDIAIDLVSIGKPIANTQIYILDETLDLLPPGIVGEICIGGAGVASGYLHKPELTGQKFVQDPFSHRKEDKIYRTGDLGRWNPDGEIEFLGRRDNQVKIRGYRIELGEIENALLKYKGIQDVVVLVHEQQNATKSLIAYFTATATVALHELKAFLAACLPEYMIPAYMIRLDRLPLTTNGKVERSALPLPGANNINYEAPENETEEILITAFEQVLGRQGIGAQDNFFELGGDSIKAIQITSRLYEAGYRLEVRNILRNPVIRQLAASVARLDKLADQSVITGPVSLTPVQQQFFAFPRLAYHHFNFALLFFSEQPLDTKMIRTIFAKLQEHHDALRMTFEVKEDHIIQFNHGQDYPFSLEAHDLTGVADGISRMEAMIQKMQGSISLEHGPMLNLSLFRLSDGDRLALVVHHLVTDVVSLRILFEDIGTLFNQYQQGRELLLPKKTDSFRVWAGQLRVYANSKTFLKEKEYWKTVLNTNSPHIVPDFPDGSNLIKDRATKKISLETADTGLLLTTVRSAFNTEINDILLSALALTLRESFGMEHCRIAMEGHGREHVLGAVNVSRTVGYFTTIYPLNITAAGDDLSVVVRRNKKRIHEVPHKGIGYGILKYLTAGEHKQDIDLAENPQIAFNYFGQFDEDIAHLPFGFSEENTGHQQDINEHREYELYVTGMTEGGQFSLTVDYSRERFSEATIQTFLENYHSALKSIIEHCCAQVAE